MGPEHPYFTQSGEDREKDGDQYIANLQDGAWAGFKSFSFSGEEKEISVIVRGDAVGTLSVSGSLGGSSLAQLPIEPSMGWVQVSARLEAPKGTTAIYFTYHGQGAMDFTEFVIE